MNRMVSRWKAALFVGSAIFATAGVGLAQNPPQPAAGQPPTPAAAQAPLYDAQQLPAEHGQVQQFTLTPRGDIDGLILTDGTEVKTPPHLSTQIAFSVKPGDTVTIHGLRAAALPLVEAVSITDEATDRTIVDNGPPGPGRPGPGRGPAPPPPVGSDASPSAPIPGLAEVQGRVRMALHGPQGDVNGALLEDGTIVRLPPPEADRFSTLLQPDRNLVAEGTELVTAVGKVFEVQQIGTSRAQLSSVQTPPPPPPGPGASPLGPSPPGPGAAPPGPPQSPPGP
jgi:hypothetical protein